MLTVQKAKCSASKGKMFYVQKDYSDRTKGMTLKLLFLSKLYIWANKIQNPIDLIGNRS